MIASRVVLNGFDSTPNNSYLYKNFIKGLGSIASTGGYAFQANLDVNGYPTIGTVGTDFSGTFVKPSAYSGKWRLSWKGKAKFSLSPSQAPNTGFTINADASSVVTNGSTTMTVNGGGGPSVRTIVDLTFNGTGGSCQIIFRAAGDFTGFSDLRLVRLDGAYSGDDAAVDGGVLENQFNQDFLDAITALNPPIIRPLDISPINFSLLARSAYSTQTATLSYVNGVYNSGAWGGVAASSDGVTYTCSGAPDSPAGAYVDGETIQLQMAADNTSTAPTLNVNGRGAATIKSYAFGSPGALPTSSDNRRIIANAIWTFIYDAASTCWIGVNSGQVGHAPLSLRVAMCNKLGKDFWWLIPPAYDDASVTAELTYIRDNLSAGLNCYFELGNELWNGAFTQTNMAIAKGIGLGFVNTSNRALHGWVGYRFSTIIDLITPVWNAVRSNSQLRGILTHQHAGDVKTKTYRFEGSDLATWGYSTAGNRPVDKAYATGSAYYVAGALIRNGGYSSGYLAGEITGLTVAADNYASGVPASMSLALDWIDNDLRSGLKNGTLGGATIDFLISQGVTWNGYDASYGKVMICYEGNYEALAPTTAQCTSVFSIATSYSALIQNLITAYKSDVRMSITMLYMYQKFFALSQAKYAASYVFGNNPQWGLQTGSGDLSSAYYATKDAMVLSNGGKRRLTLKT